MFMRFIVLEKEKNIEYKIIDTVARDEHSQSLLGINEKTGDIRVIDINDCRFVRWADVTSQDILHEIRFGFTNLCTSLQTNKEVIKIAKKESFFDRLLIKFFNFFMSEKYLILKKTKR